MKWKFWICPLWLLRVRQGEHFNRHPNLNTSHTRHADSGSNRQGTHFSQEEAWMVPRRLRDREEAWTRQIRKCVLGSGEEKQIRRCIEGYSQGTVDEKQCGTSVTTRDWDPKQLEVYPFIFYNNVVAHSLLIAQTSKHPAVVWILPWFWEGIPHPGVCCTRWTIWGVKEKGQIFTKTSGNCKS